MKTDTCYRLGILAMCVMPILAIVVLFFGISMLNSDPEISGNGYGWSQLLFPVLGLVVIPIAGLFLYIRKKTLGWILCCGYSVFMAAFAVLVSCVFFGVLEEISLSEDGVVMSWTDILTVILMFGGIMCDGLAVSFPAGQVRIFRCWAGWTVGCDSRSLCNGHPHRHCHLSSRTAEFSERPPSGHYHSCNPLRFKMADELPGKSNQ